MPALVDDVVFLLPGAQIHFMLLLIDLTRTHTQVFVVLRVPVQWMDAISAFETPSYRRAPAF